MILYLSILLHQLNHYIYIYIYIYIYTGCFKNRFTTLKAYINLVRRHVQCFELSQCSKIRHIEFYSRYPSFNTLNSYKTEITTTYKNVCEWINNVITRRLTIFEP
jgi:hypothetical protein